MFPSTLPHVTPTNVLMVSVGHLMALSLVFNLFFLVSKNAA